MNLLAIETAGSTPSVALAANGRVFFEASDEPRSHGRLILPMIESLLNQASISKQALNYLAFSAGPGRFTGLRLGAGIIQGLAFGLGLPVVPVCSLTAFAQTFARDYPNHCLQVCVDGRQNTFYFAAFETDASGQLKVLSPAGGYTPETLPDIKSEKPIIALGDGWKTLAFQASAPESVLTTVQATALGVLELATQDPEGQAVSALQALPIYMHEAF